jgi:hypothetical protein
VFCIFEKKAYIEIVVPLVQQLKFDFFGHDCVVLHAHEIRKARGDFNILLNSQVRQHFIDCVNALIARVPVTVIAAVIDKQRHIKQYRDPANPYEIALAFCMERLQRWLGEQGQDSRRTHLMVERRGAREDAKLELEFRRMVITQSAGCRISRSASWTRSTTQPACRSRISSRTRSHGTSSTRVSRTGLTI